MKTAESFSLGKEANSTRFDARLTKKQKMLFSEAASIMGFKSLSEFVIQTTQSAALQIIEKNNAVLASDKDREIFFNALVNPPKPNTTLVEGLKRYEDKFQQ